MASLAAPAPEHCPGTQSEAAGKADACKGCPNQTICEALPKGPDPAVEEIRQALAHVTHKILVLSGKGGVGKSTVTAHLAHCLASTHGLQVGVLDCDITGPSLPRMLGAQGEAVHHSGSGWSPVYVSDNVAMMSVGFLLGSEDDAVIWRGAKKSGLIKQFLRDVAWDDLDLLLIDTPPGTSDEHLALVNLLSGAGVTGAVIVSTPQEVALTDVRKEINFCEKTSLPIIGLVENMAEFVCPACHQPSKIFPATSGGVVGLARGSGLRFLGSLPLDPRVARACDEGRNFLEELEGSPAARAFTAVAQRVLDYCQSSSPRPGTDADAETGEAMEAD